MKIPKKEDHKTEFKSDWKDNICLTELCAFANAEGGSLFIGIKDDAGTVIGVKNPNKAKKWEERLPQIIYNNLGFCPHKAEAIIVKDDRTVVDIDSVKKWEKSHSQKTDKEFDFHPDKTEAIKEDGKTVFHIKVNPSDYLIKYNGCYYKRQGERSNPLKGEDLETEIKKKLSKPWDELTLREVKVSDLKTDLFKAKIKKHCLESKYLKITTAKISNYDNTELLKNLNLISEDKIKRAAVLLFHPKPYEIIPFARIKIIHKRSIDDDLPLDKDLLSQVDKALKGLSNRLNYFFISVKKDFLKDKKERKESSKMTVVGSDTNQIPNENIIQLEKPIHPIHSSRGQTQKLLCQYQENLKKDFEIAIYASLALKDYSISKEIEIEIFENKFTINIPVHVLDESHKPLSTKPKRQDDISKIRKKINESLNNNLNLCHVFKEIGIDVKKFIEKRCFPPTDGNNSETLKALDFKQDKESGWSLDLSPGGEFTGFQIHFDFNEWKNQNLKSNNSDKKLAILNTDTDKKSTTNASNNSDKKLAILNTDTDKQSTTLNISNNSDKKLTTNTSKDTKKQDEEGDTSDSKDKKTTTPPSDNPPKGKKKAWNKFKLLAISLVAIALSSLVLMNHKNIIGKWKNKIFKVVGDPKKIDEDEPGYRGPVGNPSNLNKDSKPQGTLVFQDLFKLCLDKRRQKDYDQCMGRMKKEIDETFCSQ